MNALRESLWKQFGASIDMLSNAIKMWPDEQWSTRTNFFTMPTTVWSFWIIISPILPPADFTSPLPFTLADKGVVVEDAIDDVIPDRIYSKNELLDYLNASREKCYRLSLVLRKKI